LGPFHLLAVKGANRRWAGRGERFSFESKEKQKTPFIAVKSSKIKLKQKCRSPLPGRPAKLALLCASAQRKTAGQSEKQTSLFFRLACGFSYARKLSWRHSSDRRSLPVFALKPVRRLASLQLSSPGRKRVSPLPK